MATITRNDLQIEYEEHGEGEPVVLVHGAIVGAYYWKPLIDEMLRGAKRRIITYNRRGFGDSSPGSEPVTLVREAEDLGHLLNGLDLRSAHIVGHSYGGVISLILAMDHPELVGSLTLMEPALVFLIPSSGTFAATAQKAGEIAATEGPDARIDFSFRSLSGPDYRKYQDPTWWNRILADASSGRIQGGDFLEWSPSPDELKRITMPVLAVLGGESHTVTPWFDEGHALVQQWFPQAEAYVLPNATHALHNANPGDMASTLNDFLARHPLPA